ncbi:MAG: type II secretion system protein N [Sphingomonadales bacterium]|nr:type II secretion system protein N [Sphingomonadales bacterium]PIX66456.1 MAG: type II secretion system protein N [Sphingomonadales bacterium CG_4_10_14_3_um_filter_58_15]NCO48701.1 type II secretion system protein N [Sphingomonadales bacterium]NCP00119.1 type II secretion system protein N [Sphingomonadales bacterium]NCP27903.1 type II secretion system protein N [Sphingomonadales bacterium]
MPRALTYLLIILAVVAVALFFLPLRLAVSMAGLEGSRFSAKAISGSVWNGRIEGAQLGPFPLGDLDAGVRLLPLLTGRVLMDLERPPVAGDPGLFATVGKSGNSLLVQDVTTVLSVGRQLAPLPASAIDLQAVSIRFARGRCQSASGQVRVSLDANIPGLDLKQGLLGKAECQDGVLVLPLQSGSGMEQLTVKLQGNGFYTARLFLSGSDRAWTLLLPTLGFRKVPNGYAIKVAGQLAQRNGQ